MRLFKIASAIFVALLIGFVAITWWALEAGGVAVIETTSPDGSPRETHVWYVEADGELWLEAGTPTNMWYLDIQRDPTLMFLAEDRVRNTLARPSDSTADRDRVRSLLHQKYGFRDWWVGGFVDSTKSIAVLLAPSLR
jgi:hypothetical protein